MELVVSRLHRRLMVGLAVVMLAAMASPIPSGADPGGLEEVTTFKPYGPGDSAQLATLYTEPRHRRIYSEFQGNVNGAFTQLAVQIFNADTLKPVGEPTTVPGADMGSLAARGAVDSRHRRLFVAYRINGSPGFWGLAALQDDGRRMRLLRQHDPTPDIGNPVQIFGVSYYEPADRLYIVTGLPLVATATASVPQTIAVTEYDATKFARGEAGAHIWTYRVPVCSDVPAFTRGLSFGRSRLQDDTLFFACRQVGVLGFGLGGLPGVIRVDMNPGATPADTSAFTTTVFPLSGDHSQSDVWFDPGTDRTIIGGQSQTSPVVSFWVFDGLTGTWAGSISAGARTFAGAGLDPSTGRLYVQPQDNVRPPFVGLLLAEVRPTPVQQGVSFPQHRVGSGQVDIAIDPVTRYVFARRQISAEDVRFLVLRDEVPRYTVPPSQNPDSLTTDIEEKPGITSATFSARGAGYALRTSVIGGTQGAFGNALGPFQAIPESLPNFPARGTRDIYGAQVIGAGINTSEASAAAIAANRDELNTGSDTAFIPETVKSANRQAREQSEDVPEVPIPEEVYWPFPEAECSGDESDEAETTGVSVSCEFPESRVSAVANLQEFGLGAVEIDNARTTVTVRRDVRNGMVATTLSRVEGVVIAGLVDIGSAEMEARTQAAGRSKTARSTVDRRIADVRVGHTALCEGICPDLRSVFRDIYELTSGRVQLELPDPDPRLLGTPGGAEAMVQRDFSTLVQDVQINESPPNRLEVPAIVATVVNDGPRRSRLRYELAGVQAESHYFIFKLAEPPGPVQLPPIVQQLPPTIVGGVQQFPTVPVFPNVGGGPPRQIFVVPQGAGGWEFGLTTPVTGALAGAVLAFMGVPVYLSARRRLLMEAMRQRGFG